jgi:hypothetical protein
LPELSGWENRQEKKPLSCYGRRLRADSELMTIQAVIDNMHFVPADELQGYIGTVNPRDFTRIFALELAIYTDNARITNGELCQQLVVMHECAAKRDILDRGRAKFVIQFQDADLFRSEAFM